MKVGGASLYSLGRFSAELYSILHEYRNQKVYLLVGGGDLIESMRTLNRLYTALDPVSMHWRCIELLDHTCEIAGELCHEIPVIRTALELSQFGCDKDKDCAWIRVQSFYQRGSLDDIPESWRPSENWETTSDALAWLLGMRVHATRVMLLKRSANLMLSSNIDQAAASGTIDSETVRLVRLHANESPMIEIREFGMSDR